jgi:uncharacterized membrane protein
MESPGCYLGLGLILGALITVTLLLGDTQRRRALGQIRAFAKQEKTARAIIQEARLNRNRGCVALPGAFLLILLGIALLILAIYLMTGPSGV